MFVLPLEKLIEDSARAALTAEAAKWFARLTWSTRLVVIGVVMEGIAVVHEVIGVGKQWLRQRKERADLKTVREFYPVSETIIGIEPENHTPTWVKLMAFLGLLVVVVGVGGEWRYEVKFEVATGEIQTFDGNRVTEAERQAGDAATSAKTAHDEADIVKDETAAIQGRLDDASAQMGTLGMHIAYQGPRAKLLVKVAPELVRKLAPFAGQRVSLFVCGQRGAAEQETIDTWAAVANILGTDTIVGITGAKWNILSPNLNFAANCGGAKGLGQGVMVFASKRASQSTLDAANVLGHGLAKALPPSPNKMPGLIDPDFAKLTVDEGFQDKSAPWVSVGLDRDLITVMIGEHP